MNNVLLNTVISCFGLSSSSLFAGVSSDVSPPVEVGKDLNVDLGVKPELLRFSLNSRLRYEFRDQDGSEASHAGTLRFRPGLTLFPKEDLSFFVESEHTLAVLQDYQVGTGQAANFSPFKAGHTAISDPESNELNQAYIKYKIDSSTSVTAGRQRYKLDAAAFVGNVGWRQNEQTLDAVSLKGHYKGLDYSYAVGQRVNRIFGSDATGAVEALEGTYHLLNGSYERSGSMTVGGYAYLMDFDQGSWASNNTYGAYVDFQARGSSYHVELAYQTEAGDKSDYDSLYGHATWTKKYGAVSVTAGAEYLADGFITPLSTVHAYNGFADAFIGNRLGVVDTWEGLTDFYLSVGTKVNDVVLKGKVHAFFNDSLSEQYGWEVDAVAVKPLSDEVNLLAKAAYFIGEEGTPFSKDIQQVSLQLDYQF